MKRLLLASAALAVSMAFTTSTIASAQALPVPDQDNPRIQSFSWEPGEPVRIMALPMTGLTVMLEPGEAISEILLDRRGAFEVKVSSEGDSFLLVPVIADAAATITVATDRRSYTFLAETGTGLMAAYLVRYSPYTSYASYSPPQLPPALDPFADGSGRIWSYRLKGDSPVQPAEITDDGSKTYIRFAEDQALPAIFAIGPTGEEQLVNGHMRGDVFVIDEVWQELVFRIDREKATARRSEGPEAQGG
jgi:type IV secretion system protein VirB9